MKFSRIYSFAALMFSVTVMMAHAVELDTPGFIKDKLKSELGINASDIKLSPIKGMYQVITEQGVLYVTQDGSKLITGDIYDLNDGMTNLTEKAMAEPRKKMLNELQKDMIVYKAKNEKYVVTVFTDITCGYCRKLHNEMKQYNDLGITVRYLAFPRQGVPSANAMEMSNIWCAENQKAAMDKAQAGGNVSPVTCNARIKEQYQAGNSFGVNGTPAIVLQNGTMIPGYQPAQALLETLKRVKS